MEDILGAIANIENYVAGMDFDQFCADQKAIDAVVRNLTITKDLPALRTQLERLPE